MNRLLANRNAIITFLYMEKNLIVDLSKIDSGRSKLDCDITSASLREFENVRIIREDLLCYDEGTPFGEFHRTGPLYKSTTPLVHWSDIIRVALLWKNGGISGGERVMAFTAGHMFLHFLIKSMIFAFRWDNYLSLGPPALTEAILEFCNRNDLPANKWLLCWRNSSLIIQPADSFYAISSGRVDAFYQTEVDPADRDKLTKIVSFHTFTVLVVGG